MRAGPRFRAVELRDSARQSESGYFCSRRAALYALHLLLLGAESKRIEDSECDAARREF